MGRSIAAAQREASVATSALLARRDLRESIWKRRAHDARARRWWRRGGWGEGGGHVYVQQAAAFALSYNPLLAVLLLRPLALC
jgi:hypothetical protein